MVFSFVLPRKGNLFARPTLGMRKAVLWAAGAAGPSLVIMGSSRDSSQEAFSESHMRDETHPIPS